MAGTSPDTIRGRVMLDTNAVAGAARPVRVIHSSARFEACSQKRLQKVTFKLLSTVSSLFFRITHLNYALCEPSPPNYPFLLAPRAEDLCIELGVGIKEVI